MNEGPLGNRITNVATAIGAGVGANRVIRCASRVPIVGVHGHGDDIERSPGTASSLIRTKITSPTIPSWSTSTDMPYSVFGLKLLLQE